MKFLALLSSVPFESDTILLDNLKHITVTKIAGKTVYKGKLSKRSVLLITTGIGKVNAAHTATGIIERFPVRCVLNLGIGGAYPNSGLNQGDLAVAVKEIYGDEGVITSRGRHQLVPGWSGMKSIGIPLVQDRKRKYFNEFPLDKNLAKNALKSLGHAAYRVLQGTNIRLGSFVTVSSATGTEERAVELERRFKSICENMEGAAIAQVCTIYKVPMLEVRGISNIVGVRDRRTWDIKHASENCQQAVLQLIGHI